MCACYWDYQNFSPDIVPFRTGRCPSVLKIPSENTKCIIFLSAPQRHVSIHQDQFKIFPLCVEIQGMMQQEITHAPRTNLQIKRLLDEIIVERCQTFTSST